MVKRVTRSSKAASSPGRSYNLADVDASCGPLGSVQLVIFVALVVSGKLRNEERENLTLQVIIPNSLESIVAVKVVSADVVGRVGCTHPSE